MLTETNKTMRQKTSDSLPMSQSIKNSTITKEQEQQYFLNTRRFGNPNVPRHHKIFGGSSYDRYLDILLFIWPDILEKYPDAELHIAYGWNLFDVFARTNPERRKWKEQVEMLMQQNGIYHYGRIGKKELSALRKQCGIWAYPTVFTEINCITALEAQRDGLVPVTMQLAALQETVGSGVKIEGKIEDPEVKDKYLEALLQVMQDKDTWKKESLKAQKFAKQYEWKNIAKDWIQEFTKPVSEPKVSVITITIRPGFWNIMADNLSKQTYKNFEWIIVDDYAEDRSDMADKYAKKYNLDIKYIRGDKTLKTYKRHYGLIRSNNQGWKAATGELTVWIQDFILIENNGIERLVDIYRHNPNSLIAPTDIYYNCVKPNLLNMEDWFDGNTDIITTEAWKNIRNEFKGMRKSDNYFDIELNYGAIPINILKDLNGYWEFFDNGLGFDNTQIGHRALLKGYSIIVDDTNVAKAINLWPHIGGRKENIEERDRHLAVPYWFFYKKMMEEKKLPVVRDEKLDESINYTFKVPDEIVSDKESAEWINANAEKIISDWTI